MICRICGEATHERVYTAREMMYGLRDEFSYLLCGGCGCLQIERYPEDMCRYYPETYYSFAAPEETHGSRLNDLLRRLRARHLITGRGLAAATLRRVIPAPPMFDLLRRCGVTMESRILEIGSGAGVFLKSLRRLGFSDLTGVDLFIGRDIAYEDGIRVLRKELAEIEGPFDLIIARDTLEHMPHQIETLRRIRSLLHPNGAFLMTLPVIGYAWRRYGVNWVGLDAPRHFYLHSGVSMRYAAASAGLEVFHVVYDSNEDQFIGSEQYESDIPLFDERSYYPERKPGFFSADEIAAFRRKAAELNRLQDGDRLSVCLRPV